jgi:hypothetical protein
MDKVKSSDKKVVTEGSESAIDVIPKVGPGKSAPGWKPSKATKK